MTDYNRNFPSMSDPLGETLYQLRLDGSLYALSDLTGPWGVVMPALPGKMMFHIVIQGECWLQIEDQPPARLQEGSLVLVSHGRGHFLMDDPSSERVDFFDLPVQKLGARYERLEYGGDGQLTQLVCCVMSFDELAGRQLISQLPELLFLDNSDPETARWIQSALGLMAREAQVQKPGGQTIMSNLADILVIQAVRCWVEHAPEANRGWIAALKDQHIGRALSAMHREPARHWTVEVLARRVGMSRSGFSARFSALVGEPVMSYLTRWRMLLARSQLLEGRVGLGELAESLGYQSEAAFSRAFKRTMGVPPSGVRQKNSLG